MEKIKLGKITAPVGIRGEVRVYPYTDIPERFSEIDELELDGRYVKIENARYMKDMAVLKLSCCPDRNAAEALRGKELFLDKERLWEVPEDTYFVEELIGLKLYSESGEYVGELTDVSHGAAQDIYIIGKPDGKSFMLPAVREFIKDVDLDARRMTVHLIEGLDPK
jgi:16S rRNA processing protein RimM